MAADFDDDGAVEGFDFGGLFNTALKTGGDLAGDYLRKDQKPTPQTVTQPKPDQGWVKWAIIGGVAVVVLLVAGLAFGGRGR